MKRTVLLLLALAAMPGVAVAQNEGGRFHSGPFSWTPTITLRDAGVDSNVYDEASNPRRDQSATFSPQVEGVLKFAGADVRLGGSADFVYFQRYTSERSVNGRGNARIDFKLTRIKPFVAGGYVDARERVNSEIDVRARRTDRVLTAGAAIELTPRGALEIAGSFDATAIRQGEMFLGVNLANRLNRESTGGSLKFKYELTPLTRLVLEGSGSRDRFTLSPDYDADNLRGGIGFEFEPDAVIKGRATFGFHRIEPVGSLAFGFEGFTAAVELGYVLLGRTRFDARVARDTSSSFEAQPYFLQTIYGGEVLHNLVGPLDLIARGSWETLDYPGIPERFLPEDQLKVTRYGGGLAIRPGDRVRLTLNYEIIDRAAQQTDRTYDRRRLYTTLTYGF
jgi:hypothetical protein